MKSTILAFVVMVIGCISFPSFAQQQDAQELTNAVKALTAQEIEMIRNKDAAGAASLFTSDALLVMLAPKLAVKPGQYKSTSKGFSKQGLLISRWKPSKSKRAAAMRHGLREPIRSSSKKRPSRVTGSERLNARMGLGKSLWRASLGQALSTLRLHPLAANRPAALSPVSLARFCATRAR